MKFRFLGRAKAQSSATKAVIFTKEHEELQGYVIGDYTYGRPKVRDYGGATTLKIGRFCSIAASVTILVGGEHNPRLVSTYPFATLGHWSPKTSDAVDSLSKGDVVIENDVWIGTNSLILSGVHIGNGAVVGAGSVVVSDVNDYEVVAGNPARHIRYRFSSEVIQGLLKTQWWHRPFEEIRSLLPIMMSGDIERFIEAVLVENTDVSASRSTLKQE